MNIDAEQYAKIVQASFADTPDAKLTPAHAELVIAIAQLAVAADRVEDPDEQALFASLAQHVYGQAKLKTSPPTLGPVEDEEQRIEHLQSHAAQLRGTPAAALAYSIAYVLTIADLDLAPEEGELLDLLVEALGLDPERADDLTATVAEAITPAD
jgi:tellurite resistance protein